MKTQDPDMAQEIREESNKCCNRPFGRHTKSCREISEIMKQASTDIYDSWTANPDPKLIKISSLQHLHADDRDSNDSFKRARESLNTMMHIRLGDLEALVPKDLAQSLLKLLPEVEQTSIAPATPAIAPGHNNTSTTVNAVPPPESLSSHACPTCLVLSRRVEALIRQMHTALIRISHHTGALHGLTRDKLLSELEDLQKR